MTFLRPAAFLLLPALMLLLWIIRQIRVRRPVPATTFILLARALAKLGTRPRRRSFALREVLLLLPAALVVMALAGPVFEPTSAARPVVVLVDRSASMGTRSEAGTRLDRAQARLPAMIGTGFRTAGVPPAPVTEEASVWRPTIAEGSAAELVRAAVERLAAGYRVVVVTDQELPDLPAGAGLLVVTGEAPNAGIAACGLDDADRLLVRIAARGQVLPAFEVVIEDPAGATGSRTLPVPQPSGVGRWVFQDVRPPIGGRIRARLLAPDANPLDDEVVLVAAPGTPRIGFPAEGFAALWRAFAAQPGIEVFRGEGPCDFRVASLNEAPRGWSLLVAPVAAGSWATGPPRAVRGPLHGREGLFRSAADDLELPAVHVLDPLPKGAEILASVGSAPLLVRGGATLVLLQAPELSSWPARESFPLFIFDLLRHLDLRPAAGWRTSRGDETLAFVRISAREARLRSPSGGVRTILAGEDGRFVFSLEEPGVHELSPSDPGHGSSVPVIVSGAVLSDLESAGAPAGKESSRAPADDAATVEVTSIEPLVLVLAAAAFLLIEFLPAFRRRGSLISPDRSRPPTSPGT